MGSGAPRKRRSGLVIGAGATVGGAWAAGVLCALAETEGYEATASEVVVGTSAGSVVAALVAAGVPPREMADLFSDGDASVGTPVTIPVEVSDRVRRTLSEIPWPVPVPGNLRLAARTLGQPGRRSMRTAVAALAPRGRGSLAPVGEMIGEVWGNRAWPDRPRTWLAAMDYDSGRRVAFGAAGEPVTSPAEAVMASCSVPGLFPPRVIGDHRYVDGGAVSVTNADLLLGERLDEVVVLAPMVPADPVPGRSATARLEHRMRQHLAQRLQWEVWRLAVVGTSVRVFVPTVEDAVAMGSNWMDARRYRRVFETAVRTTTLRLAPSEPPSSRPGDVDGVA